MLVLYSFCRNHFFGRFDVFDFIREIGSFNKLFGRISACQNNVGFLWDIIEKSENIA
jgi:hypothetical protein